ncbi:MAG: YidC/Oxa1 family membrane protein insertase [Clostridia bacterium]|nr:YidC/Oxa1 family membrane protein insertase [Clostridia bacterium]
MNFFDIINKPIGWILEVLNNLCGNNFALAILLLTIVVNVITIPLSIHSQKTSAKQARLRPRLDVLKKKCGDDKMKYNEEMQKLYAEEGVSMTGGCLPMFIRLPFFLAVYNVVRNPLTYITGLPAEVLNGAKEILAKVLNKPTSNLTELDIIGKLSDSNFTNQLAPDALNSIKSAAETVDFNFFGIQLEQSPVFSMNIFGDFQLIWLIPILSFLTALISGMISSKLQKRSNPEAPNMGCLMIGMPIFSLVIAFSVPGAVGFYWACSNLVSGIIQVFLQLYYSPNHIIAKQQVADTLKNWETEQKKINRRA